MLNSAILSAPQIINTLGASCGCRGYTLRPVLVLR